MRRALRIVCAALVLSGAAHVSTPQPAAAHVDACSYYGLMEIFGRLGQYPIHPNQRLGFEIIMYDPGGCLGSDQLVVTGTLYGTCGSAVLSGRSDQGHTFEGDWLGTQWNLRGKLTGTLSVTEIPLYPLCISGAAWAFEVVGPLVSTHLT